MPDPGVSCNSRLTGPWLRLYAAELDDPRVQRLSPHLFRAWINLLCLAAETDGTLPSLPDTAFRLRMSEHDAGQTIDELVLLGLLVIAPDGTLAPHDWPDRQFVAQTSTERVRRWRARQAAAGASSGRATARAARNVSARKPRAEAAFHDTSENAATAVSEASGEMRNSLKNHDKILKRYRNVSETHETHKNQNQIKNIYPPYSPPLPAEQPATAESGSEPTSRPPDGADARRAGKGRLPRAPASPAPSRPAAPSRAPARGRSPPAAALAGPEWDEPSDLALATLPPEVESELDVPPVAGDAPEIPARVRLRVAETLGIADAGPLVAAFRAWQAGLPAVRRAREPVALFQAVAAQLYAGLSPAARARCGAGHGPDPPPIARPVRASPELKAFLARSYRR